MMRRVLLVYLLLGFLINNSFAQDSLMYLSKDDVFSIVRSYHPVISQAKVRVSRAGADVLTARGTFDPVLAANGDQKTFGGQQYYSYFNPEIKIPTWYGLSVKAGVEEIYGDRVNPERSLGKTSYAGLELSALKGLIFDDRRAALRLAQAYKDMSEVEQQIVVNDILLQANERYWNWVKSYNLYELYRKVVKVNEERFDFIKLEYEQGNKAAIDTTEALSQLLGYRLQENEAYVDFQNSGWELSTYLWLDDNSAMIWSDRLVPDSSGLDTRLSLDTIPSLDKMISLARSEHPKLNIFTYKLNALGIEKRLKQQEFLPQLDLKANMLNKGYDLPYSFTTPFLENNYKAGFEFKLPLLYRKAIGSYRAAKLKITETELEKDYTIVQVENKVKVYYTEVLNLYRQIEIFEDAYYNFSKMYNAELLRYQVGESNLFLINSRENKLLDARRKLIDLKAKWHLKYGNLLWSAGVM